MRRLNQPRFQGENFDKNLQLVQQVKALASKKGVTPGQLALAWVHSQVRSMQQLLNAFPDSVSSG